MYEFLRVKWPEVALVFSVGATWMATASYFY